MIFKLLSKWYSNNAASVSSLNSKGWFCMAFCTSLTGGVDSRSGQPLRIVDSLSDPWRNRSNPKMTQKFEFRQLGSLLQDEFRRTPRYLNCERSWTLTRGSVSSSFPCHDWLAFFLVELAVYLERRKRVQGLAQSLLLKSSHWSLGN